MHERDIFLGNSGHFLGYGKLGYQKAIRPKWASQNTVFPKKNPFRNSTLCLNINRIYKPIIKLFLKNNFNIYVKDPAQIQCLYPSCGYLNGSTHPKGHIHCRCYGTYGVVSKYSTYF